MRQGISWLALLALAGCGDLPSDVNPRAWWRNISGAYLDERLPPPGTDRPYPNLSTVPARPVPPDAAARAALSASLAADREGSRTEQQPADGAPVFTGDQPPARPRLAAAPIIRPEAPQPTAAPVRAPQAAGRPAAPAPPELLGLPSPPTADLLAPPPPPALR